MLVLYSLVKVLYTLGKYWAAQCLCMYALIYDSIIQCSFGVSKTMKEEEKDILPGHFKLFSQSCWRPNNLGLNELLYTVKCNWLSDWGLCHSGKPVVNV